MAKMKRARQKFHAAAQKDHKKKGSSSKSAAGLADNDAAMLEDTDIMPPPDPTAGPRGESLFKDVNISGLQLLSQKLPDFDARSSVTSKTFKGQNLKKKEKLQLRREAWMAKMDSIQSTKKKNKQRKQKQNTPIVGDLTPMEDALPTLELLLKKSAPLAEDKQTDEEKPRSIPKERKRKKQMLEDISLFHQVQSHPMFQENAAATIKDHLRHKMKQEDQEMHS